MTKSFTNIFEAALNGAVNDVRFFVEEQGVDVDSKDENGNTSLVVAVYRENVEVAQFLISRGANVNTNNDNSVTPLLLAVARKNSEIVCLFHWERLRKLWYPVKNDLVPCLQA